MKERSVLRAQIGRLEQGMQAQQALLDSQQEGTSLKLAATKEKLEGLLPACCTATWVRMHELILFCICAGFQGIAYACMPDTLASC